LCGDNKYLIKKSPVDGDQMSCEYIIIQAGGKGTRLEHLTRNKPKCLVPVNNLPMIFHLFKKFRDKKFIIIGDYHYDVLREYLKAFADVKYLLVNSEGKQGTLSGLSLALRYIPKDKPFMFIWSDLVLSPNFEIPLNDNYIGISKDFRCRWMYDNQTFSEQPSTEHGVAGLFIFSGKDILGEVPLEGEFVRWLSKKNILFRELPLYESREYGLISEYNKLQTQKCRPFNQLYIEDNRVVKIALDKQGQDLAVKEKSWYRLIEDLNYKSIPKIYQYEPLSMEKINGKNIYEYKDLSLEGKTEILTRIILELQKLHNLSGVETDYFSMKEAYITKTFERLAKVRDLIPYSKQKYININGRECRNIYFYQDELEKKLNMLTANSFKLLHGDCTFSNLMLNENLEPVFIDPRGYFGHTSFFGDPAYDWAKLYYSLVGNYDQFNLKNFQLYITDSGVNLQIESNGWEQLQSHFFELLGDQVSEKQIKLIHAIIWLSLTTYAWEDYDSICGAFYNGLFYLEEVL